MEKESDGSKKVFVAVKGKKMEGVMVESASSIGSGVVAEEML